MSAKKILLLVASILCLCMGATLFIGSLRPFAPDVQQAAAPPTLHAFLTDAPLARLEPTATWTATQLFVEVRFTRVAQSPDTPTPVPTAVNTPDTDKTSTSVPAQQTYDAMATRARATPVPTKGATPTPRPIDQTTNFLLIGTDKRPNAPAWQPNTDVLMVVFLDTANQRVAVVSFPRDLVVAIPGHQAFRINYVYHYGLAEKGPTGGAELLKQVMRAEYNIRIDHWALIDFDGLRKIIDTLGGIQVEVPCPLEDTIDEEHFVIPAGTVQMDYSTAKRYVQSRYSTSDTSRNFRQQRVLWAMANKALEMNAPDRVPVLYEQLKEAVQTNMTVFDLVSLVPAVYQLDLRNHPDRFRALVLQPPAIYQWTSSQGAWLYMPNYDEIRKTLDHIFDAPVIAPAQASPAECPTRPAPQPTDVTGTPTATVTPAP